MSLFLESFAVVSIVAAAALALYLVAVLRSWFAQLPHGFLVALVSGFIGLSVLAVWLSGAWAYRTAQAIIVEQVGMSLGNVGDIIERQIQDELDEALLQLRHVASELRVDHLQETSASELEHALLEVQHVNARFVQISLVGKNGGRLAVTSLADKPADLPRVGVAYCLDGKTYVSDPYVGTAFGRDGHDAGEHEIDLCVPILNGTTGVGGVVGRFDVQDNLTDLLASATFNQSGSATLLTGDGHVLADPRKERLNSDLSKSQAVQNALAGQSAHMFAEVGGVPQFISYRPVKNPATINPKPWALLTQMSAAEALAPLHALARQIGLGIAGLAIVGLLTAWTISWSITRPVAGLVEFVRRVRGGDLTAEARVSGRDVHGQLSTALNDMVFGLRERDRVKEIFGRYVTTEVSEAILKGDVQLGGQRRRVTILFSDIRNFTTMSEHLTPEETVLFLNNYFSEMVEAVFEHRGMLDKFLGDGLMAVFGATEDDAPHAEQAVRTALRMNALVAKINGERAMRGVSPIAIGIGIHTDEVIVGNIGSRRRLEYTVIGDGVNTASRLESMNKELGTTILISDNTYQDVMKVFACRPLQQVHLKGRSDVTAFEVLSVVGV
jgi:class 3 adenylate cyclase